MIMKEKNSPKIFKIFKILKKREKAKSKAKSKAMALASLVSFQEQNQKQEWIRFAHKAILLASLGLDVNITWSLCSVNPIFRRNGAIVIRERAGQNFDSVQSLVDTRSANPC